MINWRKLPRERGIYQITTGRVSYVGLSDNIQLRVKQHLESTSCRSRIILDTNKAKIKVLERLPHSNDKTLALREWYWFNQLKRKGHVMVNDPKTLGRTKSGQYIPTQRLNTTRSPQLGFGFKVLGMTTFVVSCFSLGFLITEQLLPPMGFNAWEILTDEPLNACQTPITQGSSQRKIQQLQRQLQQLGYYQGIIDGIYGTTTKNAVIQFQKDHNLQMDGTVGCETETVINDLLENT